MSNALISDRAILFRMRFMLWRAYETIEMREEAQRQSPESWGNPIESPEMIAYAEKTVAELPTTVDRTLMMEEFAERYLEPAVSRYMPNHWRGA